MSNYLQARYVAGLAVAVVLVAGGAFLFGRGTGPAPAAAPCATGTAMPPMGSVSSADASQAQFIGQQAGTHLAGDAPLTVDAAQVRALGNQIPAGASVGACADRITFSTATVSFVVEAVPPDNPDMTFRIAGLVNPVVVVPVGARVTVEFVNADSDQAHGWVVTGAQPPFAFRPVMPPAFADSYAAVIGDPTAAGHGARVIAFTAGAKGSYNYLCPMPGHAEMGMHGAFIVR
jgi:rusticyanin